MDREDARRVRRDQLLDPLRVDVVGARVDVAEDRPDLLPLQRVGGRDERERRDDDLALERGCADRDLQRHGAVAHGDAVRHVEGGRHGRLELAHERPVVCQPARVDRARDALEQPRAVADVRPSHVQRLCERRLGAEQREVAHAPPRSRSAAR
jgi:hypothetical protein